MKMIICRFSVGSGARFCIRPRFQIAMLAILFWLPTVTAETVTIPNGAETRENPYNKAEPFSRSGDIVSQQIYSPSLFPVIPTPGQVFQLDGIVFRLSTQGSGGGDSTARFGRVEILVSSSGGPFSTALSQNHGQDLAVVYDQALTLSGLVPAGTTPSTFDLEIPFTMPFLYNPSVGALVVEIRKYGPEGLSVLGGAEIPGSTFYFNRGFGVETSGNIGLETSFTYQVVPEPSVNAIVILGIVCVLATRCKHR